MKRFIAAVLAVSAFSGLSHATTIAYDQNLVNGVVVTTKTYTIDMSVSPVDLLTAQAVMSSATPSAVTFTDGRVSTGSFTLTSTATLKGGSATNTLTVNTNSALSPAAGTDTITVSSNGVSALSGAVITLTAEGNTLIFDQGFQWQVGASSAATAASIAAAINGQRYWTATSSFGVVTITCANAGTRCNTYTVADTTPTALTIGSVNLTGGQDPATFTINSQLYLEGVDWLAGVTSSNTAANIAAAINSLDTQGVTASTTSSTVVTLVVTAVGSAGNSFTLASSTNSALTRGGATFSGGRAHPIVSVNGTAVTEGTDWTVSTATGTVVSIANALGGSSSLSPLISTTTTLFTSSGTVNLTSKSVGLSTNYKLLTTAVSGLAASGPNMRGGLDSAVNTAASKVTVPNHELVTGAEVLFTSGAVTISPLVNQTTYYIIALDPNTLQLATTSTGAVAGTFIAFTSSSTAGPNTFTLSPLPLTGTMLVTWQGSDDNANWSNLSVSAMTFGSPYAAASTLWDFGAINLRFVRAQVAGPTTGGANVTIRAMGKRYGSGL